MGRDVIDIDGLTEEELVALNARIVERLRHLEQVKTHASMLRFRPGDRVSFRASDGREVSGVLVKYNSKTVTVITGGGQRWNVSPGLLRAEAMEGSVSRASTVVPIKRPE